MYHRIQDQKKTAPIYLKVAGDLFYSPAKKKWEDTESQLLVVIGRGFKIQITFDPQKVSYIFGKGIFKDCQRQLRLAKQASIFWIREMFQKLRSDWWKRSLEELISRISERSFMRRSESSSKKN